jgi:cytochrome b pre-mRNA-processing protein 3
MTPETGGHATGRSARPYRQDRAAVPAKRAGSGRTGASLARNVLARDEPEAARGLAAYVGAADAGLAATDLDGVARGPGARAPETGGHATGRSARPYRQDRAAVPAGLAATDLDALMAEGPVLPDPARFAGTAARS